MFKGADAFFGGENVEAMPKTRFEFKDTGPIYPRDLFPGVGGGHTDTVNFDYVVADRIRSLYMSSPVVSTAVNQFVTYVTRSKLELAGDGAAYIGEEQFEREIVPAITAMILEWVLYGYTNVCAGKSRVDKGKPTLVVVPAHFVRQSIKWDDNWQVTYTAETVGGSDSDASRVRVLCAYPPDARGRLTSKVSHCITHLGYAEHLWTTYITGSERGINPVYLFVQDRQTGGTLPGVNGMPLSSSIITSGGLGQQPMDQLLQHAEEDATEYTEKVLQAARKQRFDALAIQRAEREAAKRASESDQVFDTERVLPGTLRAQIAADPLDNIYPAPPGYTIANGPDFKTPAEFTLVMNIIAEELYRALGLPVIMLQSRADTASNVEFAINMLNENVVQFQRRITPLIGEALDMVFSKQIERERADRALAQDVISIANDGQMPAGDEPPPPTPPARFEVNFITNPITSFELIHQIYQTGAIKAEAFQDMTLSITNLPASAKRPKMEEWLKAQRESEAQAKRPRT